jgi:hypothetical protein
MPVSFLEASAEVIRLHQHSVDTVVTTWSDAFYGKDSGARSRGRARRSGACSTISNAVSGCGRGRLTLHVGAIHPPLDLPLHEGANESAERKLGKVQKVLRVQKRQGGEKQCQKYCCER